MNESDLKRERVVAWVLGTVVVIAVTAQFWGPWLDRVFPVGYEPTSPQQRVWQMNCGGDISRYEWIERGC